MSSEDITVGISFTFGWVPLLGQRGLQNLFLWQFYLNAHHRSPMSASDTWFWQLWFAKMSSLARSLRISNIQIQVYWWGFTKTGM